MRSKQQESPNNGYVDCSLLCVTRFVVSPFIVYLFDKSRLSWRSKINTLVSLNALEKDTTNSIKIPCNNEL